jgi:hypothetical protein
MKCLRIYAPRMGSLISVMLIFPRRQCLSFLMKPRSSHYPASRIRFVHVPAGVREAGWHIPPGRVLAVWLDGLVEFETTGNCAEFQLGMRSWWRIHMERGISHGIP